MLASRSWIAVVMALVCGMASVLTADEQAPVKATGSAGAGNAAIAVTDVQFVTSFVLANLYVDCGDLKEAQAILDRYGKAYDDRTRQVLYLYLLRRSGSRNFLVSAPVGEKPAESTATIFALLQQLIASPGVDLQKAVGALQWQAGGSLDDKAVGECAKEVGRFLQHVQDRQLLQKHSVGAKATELETIQNHVRDAGRLQVELRKVYAATGRLPKSLADLPNVPADLTKRFHYPGGALPKYSADDVVAVEDLGAQKPGLVVVRLNGVEYVGDAQAAIRLARDLLRAD